ncbi:MAG: peptidoglycan DD-metalloendopeptidase family protein [Oscillospiraceae bacterium]|nr:peptidoglycan DD-metalloendopeptidase family protein [Oscillospiraceae bacterium]
MKQTRKILSLVLALVMVFALVPEETLVPVAHAVTQEQIDDLKNTSKELASESSKLKLQLAELKDQRTSAIQRKNLLDQQIDLTVQQISNTEKQISGFETMLAQTAYELEEAEKQEEAQYAVFCERARVMEEAGSSSYWAVLFKANSFSDLLSRLSDIQEVMNYDQGVLDELRSLQEEIKVKHAEQEELMAQSEEAKAELEVHKKDLDQQYAEAEALVAEIDENVDEYQEQLDELNAEREQIQAEIVKKSNELAQQMNMTATKGGYIWPETVSRKITSPMGGRNTGIPGASTNHKGVDIGGVGYTTNVLATKAGVVITSKLSSSYGNYVVISHGPGNTTLYAHMSSRAVKEGDTVTQGQIIGVTGNTGISRGAHLHYEITENGVRVNPLDYLPNYIKGW